MTLNKNPAFSYEAGFHLGDALKENKTVRKILLHDCTLTTSGAKYNLYFLK